MKVFGQIKFCYTLVGGLPWLNQLWRRDLIADRGRRGRQRRRHSIITSSSLLFWHGTFRTASSEDAALPGNFDTVWQEQNCLWIIQPCQMNKGKIYCKTIAKCLLTHHCLLAHIVDWAFDTPRGCIGKWTPRTITCLKFAILYGCTEECRKGTEET